MAKETPNFGLIKPDPSDLVNVEDLNKNLDLIDDELGKISGNYVLDLRDAVEVSTSGATEVEQQFDITDNVDLPGLIQAIEAGQTVKVMYSAKFEIIGTKRYSMSIDLTEAALDGYALDGDGLVLSGIGLSMEYAVDDLFACNFTRLYVTETSCTLGFTPASIMVKSVNGAKPDVNGNVTVEAELSSEVKEEIVTEVLNRVVNGNEVAY